MLHSAKFLYILGYALDPTVDGSTEEGRTIIGATEMAEESGGKTVFESTSLRASDKRKRHRNDNPADVEGFLGPWGGYIDEKRVIKPTEEEAAELEEILAKRNKRGKPTEEKPLEEKTVLHSKITTTYLHIYLQSIRMIHAITLIVKCICS